MTATRRRPSTRSRARALASSPLLTKLMLAGRRAPLEARPDPSFEDVGFAATDGVNLRGWFIPAAAASPAPAVVFVHGWLWNRLGNVEGRVPFHDRSVDFLPAAHALHRAGFGVLLFDLRNHGKSGRALPVTYGPQEAHDVRGAIAYLGTRADVDRARIGALGCSMGANAVLYGLPYAPPLKAFLAVQPARVAHFNHNFAVDFFGKLGPALLKPIDPLYALLRAPRLKAHDPAIPARGAGATIVSYVQGTGDQWGVMADVEAMVEATPNALPLNRYESSGRYEGYRYVNEEVDEVVDFFATNL